MKSSIYIGIRTDGKPGTGEASDPYDASTPDKFDALLQQTPPETVINILPGEYLSRGCTSSYYDAEADGPTVKPGWKMRGAGMGATVIKLLPGGLKPDHTRYWLGPCPNFVETNDVEIADLTIDCQLTSDAPEASVSGALYVMGSHNAFRRLEVIGWGAVSKHECFPLVLSVGHSPFSSDYTIEGCRVHKMGYLGSCATAISIFGMRAFPQYVPEAWAARPAEIALFATGGVIRNNYVDAYLPDGSIHQATMGIAVPGLNEAMIEGNHITGCNVGGPWQDSEVTCDTVISGNRYWDCRFGIAIQRGYNGTATAKTRDLVIRDNIIYLAKRMFYPTQLPIGINLCGDNPDYSKAPKTMPKAFWTFAHATITGNEIGFVQNRWVLKQGSTFTAAPPDQLGWDKPAPTNALAMVLTRIRGVEVSHNIISKELIRPRLIRLRGCGATNGLNITGVTGHSNRNTIGGAVPLSIYRADNGTYAKNDLVPLDADWLKDQPNS